jgi:hypothetical protein
MTNVLERVGTAQTESHQITPFTGVSPCTGELEMEILDTERFAVEHLVNAYKAFCKATKNYDTCTDTLIDEFTDGIHRAQLAVGTIRFYHTLNQEYRLHMPNTPAPETTPEEQHQSLRDQQEQFLGRWTFQTEELSFQPVIDGFIGAWEQILTLTHDFPDQHVYEDFVKGIVQCEAVLVQLRPEVR